MPGDPDVHTAKAITISVNSSPHEYGIFYGGLIVGIAFNNRTVAITTRAMRRKTRKNVSR